IKLLASTAAPTNTSKRWRPSARQRFMPRPRNSTEMRPSMPARKRCPSLKAGLFSYALRFTVFFPPRCGRHTTLTPFFLQDFTFVSLKKPRSELYNSGARPKFSLWRSRLIVARISLEHFILRNQPLGTFREKDFVAELHRC